MIYGRLACNAPYGVPCIIIRVIIASTCGMKGTSSRVEHVYSNLLSWSFRDDPKGFRKTRREKRRRVATLAKVLNAALWRGCMLPRAGARKIKGGWSWRHPVAIIWVRTESDLLGCRPRQTPRAQTYVRNPCMSHGCFSLRSVRPKFPDLVYKIPSITNPQEYS